MHRFNFWHYHLFRISQYRKGLPLARGPLTSGAQFGLIGQIGLKPALVLPKVSSDTVLFLYVQGLQLLEAFAGRPNNQNWRIRSRLSISFQVRWPFNSSDGRVVWSVCLLSCRLGFDSESGQTNDFKIGIHSFPA